VHRSQHTHAIASGVDSGAVMAELFAKDTGTCRGTGGSMHIYDVDTHFQGGWALVSEQLPYAAGAARSILLDRMLEPEKHVGDDRISIVSTHALPHTAHAPASGTRGASGATASVLAARQAGCEGCEGEQSLRVAVLALARTLYAPVARR
jgi:hypothetical protein